MPCTNSNDSKNPKKLNLYKFYINDAIKNKEQYNFKDNEVNTKKYNIITFLPKALLIQFIRVANIYFLISAILQCIPITLKVSAKIIADPEDPLLVKAL